MEEENKEVYEICEDIMPWGNCNHTKTEERIVQNCVKMFAFYSQGISHERAEYFKKPNIHTMEL